MNKQHKWAREIKAWADGAEIEYKFEDGEWSDWFDQIGWFDYYEFRIKPQPKEPQYLYVYYEKDKVFFRQERHPKIGKCINYLGKIKLELEDD